MRIITKHGDNIQLDNNVLPESITDWTCQEASIIQDNVKLKKCWLVIVMEEIAFIVNVLFAMVTNCI